MQGKPEAGEPAAGEDAFPLPGKLAGLRGQDVPPPGRPPQQPWLVFLKAIPQSRALLISRTFLDLSYLL